MRDKGLTDKDTIRAQTLMASSPLRLTPDGRVTVDMGRPALENPPMRCLTPLVCSPWSKVRAKIAA